jgi:hypothetical protein
VLSVHQTTNQHKKSRRNTMHGRNVEHSHLIGSPANTTRHISL